MRLTLKSILAPPAFDNEDDTQLAIFLNVIQWLMLACALSIAAMGMVTNRNDSVFPALAVAAAVLITFWVARRGRLFLAGLGLLLLTLGIITAHLAGANGVHDVFLLSYVTLIVIASLILSRSYFILFTLVELVCLAVLIYVEVNGVVRTPLSHLTELSDFYSIGAILILTSLAVRLMADSLQSSLHRARRELRERQQAELALQENRAFLADLVENSGALIVAKDSRGRYELINRKWEDVTGINREQAIGHTDLELFPGDIGEQFNANDLMIMQADAVHEVEEFLDAPSGRRYFNSVKFPLHRADGKVRGIGGMITETTARRKAEQALRESEETLRLVVEQTGQIVYLMDIPPGRAEWFGAVETLLGYTPEDVTSIIPDKWSDYIHPEDRPAAIQAFVEATKTPGTYRFDYRFRHKDGRYLFIEDSGVTLADTNNCSTRMVGVLQDITRRKQIEDEMRAQSRRAHAMAEISQVLAGMTRDPQQLLDTVLRRCADLIGDGAILFLYDPERPILSLAAVAHPDPEKVRLFYEEIDAHPVYADEAAFGRVISTSQPVLYPIIDMERLKANAPAERRSYHDKFPMSSAMFAPLRAEGAVLGVISMARLEAGRSSYTPADLDFLQDIADRAAMALLNARLYETLEERVRKRTAELESVNLELEAFSYSVSHDLRAPLRAIDGFSMILQEENTNQLDEDGQHCLNQIRKSTQLMGRLIEDILQISRLSRHEMKKQRVNLKQLAGECFESLRYTYRDLDVEFSLADIPVVQADPGLMRQVFTNLLDNALKYSSKREKVRIEVDCTQADKEIVCIVHDNGAGFDMRYADKLFAPFQRLHRVDEFEGTGIGLANVKRIISRHGGQVWAKGELDKGASFYFSLPMKE